MRMWFRGMWLAAVVASVSFAQQKEQDRSELRGLMHQFLNELQSLQPFMVSEKRFSGKENRERLEKHLSELARLSSKVSEQKSLRSASYRISGAALNEHIQNAYRAFKYGNAQYARWALASTPVACASCHTQGVADLKPLWSVKESDLEGTPLEKADFLFATRNYGAAEEMFTQFIRSYAKPESLGGFMDLSDLEKALKKKLTVWVRVRRDLAGGIASLEKDLQNPKLPSVTRDTMKKWVNQMKRIAPRAKKNSALHGEKLLALARQQLPGDSAGFLLTSHPDLVNYLWLSGLLYEELNTSKENEQTPELLYWLGVIDIGLNNEFFFSLGDSYLRDCVDKYPKQAITPRCYARYEAEITQMYTGSRGTEIPSDVQADLKRLKSKAGL